MFVIIAIFITGRRSRRAANYRRCAVCSAKRSQVDRWLAEPYTYPPMRYGRAR